MTTPRMDVSDLFPHIAGSLCSHVHPSYQHEAWQRMVNAIAEAHRPKPHAKPGNGPGGANELRRRRGTAESIIDDAASRIGPNFDGALLDELGEQR